MDFLLILGLALFAFWVYRLQKRIEMLEAINVAEAQTPAPAKPAENQVVEDDGIDRSKWPAHLKTVSAKTKSAPISKADTSPPFNLENFLGQKLFPILGAASIVIAIGFFAVWAFANGWVGPMGRIATGTMVSLSLIGLGEWLKNKYPDFFTSLVAAGLAGLIITTLLSHYVYDFISETQSLVLLALQAAAGVLLSLRYNSRILANFSIAAGLLAPWFTGELEPMLVLPFILILSIAGFVLALYKKWPEIFISLLTFSSSYIFAALTQLTREKINHNYTLNSLESVSTIDPLQLLGFAFIIYTLIGSAGVIRLVRNYKSTEPPKEESREILLFTFSLVLFNLCAYGVFYAQSWEHIGFLIGAQAFGLWALSDWFKNKKWFHFYQLTLSSSLLFIILATLWELRNIESIVLILALIIEGLLMCLMGQMSSQKIYEWFGRITIFIAFLHGLSLGFQDFMLEALLTFTLMAAFMYSATKPQYLSDKIWLGLSLFLSSALLFSFSFESGEIPNVLQNILPSLWVFGLLYTAYQYKNFFLQVTSVLAYAVLAILTVNNGFSNDLMYLATWLPIAALGGLIYAQAVQASPKNTPLKVIAYVALLILTLAWIWQTALVMSEPLITISWLALAGLFMALGLTNKPLTELRHLGIGLMLFIVAKLYLIDIWQWDIPVRVMAFSALGVALLSIGFFYQKTWLKK